jgi:hypothetical protein
MVANAIASGTTSSDSAKKRKGPPSANEIFTDPVPVVTNDSTPLNASRVPTVPQRIYVNSQTKVRVHHSYVSFSLN